MKERNGRSTAEKQRCLTSNFKLKEESSLVVNRSILSPDWEDTDSISGPYKWSAQA